MEQQRAPDANARSGGEKPSASSSIFDALRVGPYNKISAAFGVPGSISQGRGGLRSWSTSRVGNFALAGAMLGGITLALGPWIIETNREYLAYNYELQDPDMIPLYGNEYWVNEWRKGYTPWRRGEAGVKDFFAENFLWVKKNCGRDLFRPDKWFKPTAKQALPRAFVPLCGDSPIVGELGKMGYEVDAVDVSDCAIRALAEKTDGIVPPAKLRNIHVHLDDFFGAEFWRQLPGARFDLIYDRQGITAIGPKDREDYAFLLRRALKPDGVILIESTFRTPHVGGNKFKGPPFDMTEQQLALLFPAHDGFAVKCHAAADEYLKDFGPEARVTGKIYKEHWSTQFPCVAFRPQHHAQSVSPGGQAS